MPLFGKFKPWRGPQRRLWPSQTSDQPLPFRQSDWPNPNLDRTRTGFFEVSVAGALVLTLLAPSNAVVRGPSYTPYSARVYPIPDQVDNTLVSPIAVNLLSRPTFQTDWPVPPGPNRFRIPEQVANTLVNLLAQPTVQTDWQNPRGPTSLAPDVVQNILARGLAQPFRAPDLQNPARTPVGQAIDPPNLLGTTLAAAPAAAPFIAKDLPNPAGRIGAQPVDPPNLLTGKLVPAPLPVSQPDWPNPGRATPAQAQDFRNLLTSTLGTPPAPLPLNQADWPNPKGKVPGQGTDQQNLLTSTLFVAPSVVLRQPSLYQRIVLRYPIPDVIPNTAVIIPPFVAGTPFAQANWPNPTLARQILQTLDPPNLLTTTLLVQPPLTWTVDLFATPNRVALEQQPPNLLTSTLSTPPAPLPFNQADWPNPLRSIPAQAFASQNLFGTALAPAPIPFAQADWQNPIPSRAAQLQGTIASNVVALTTPPPPLPNNQADWPNPRGYEYPSSLRTFVAFAPIGFFPPTPPNKHKLYMDIVTGRLFWQISETAPGSPTLIVPLS